MTNYYSLFSVILDKIPQKAATWLINKISDYEEKEEITICNMQMLVKNKIFTGVWLWSEETFDMEALSECIQEMLIKFNINKAVSIEWAETCSRPRAASFGGGWVVVAQKEIVWGSTYSAAREAVEALTTGNMKL